jgi:putative heme iron utilization protein
MAEAPNKKDVLRPVDDAARRQAGDLLRLARHGALAALEPGTGAPLASRVSLACDLDGSPVFLISQLSAHFGALEADPRCSLLLGEPGRGDPLAHPRITLIGRAEKTDGALRARLRGRFLSRHPKAELYADFGDFAFWRVSVERASLNAGFGKAYELTAKDLIAPQPEGLEALEPEAVAHMNADHADAVALYARMAGAAGGAWRLSGLDARGLDLTLGDDTARLWFDRALTGAEELRPMLIALARRARSPSA